MKFRKKPVVIEAISFDELVAHGRDSALSLVAGVPWSFRYQGHAITHENDDCYLIPTLEGTMKFTRGDMLITGVAGEIYPCKPDIFAMTYEPATSPPAVEKCASCSHSRDEHPCGDECNHAWPGDSETFCACRRYCPPAVAPVESLTEDEGCECACISCGKLTAMNGRCLSCRAGG